MQNAYGLTETSPAIAARQLRYNVSNVSNVLKFCCPYTNMCVSVHLHENCFFISKSTEAVNSAMFNFLL